MKNRGVKGSFLAPRLFCFFLKIFRRRDFVCRIAPPHGKNIRERRKKQVVFNPREERRAVSEGETALCVQTAATSRRLTESVVLALPFTTAFRPAGRVLSTVSARSSTLPAARWTMVEQLRRPS